MRKRADYSFSHRRYNPLTGDWILVSPQREKRPWNGNIEALPAVTLPPYHSGCYLCPGNKRTNGEINPKYSSTFVFTNDHPALISGASGFVSDKGSDFFKIKLQSGVCRVICYSPDHALPMAQMRPAQILGIINAWIDEYRSLGADKSINYIQIFENRGFLMGTSNPHPHGQIWAGRDLPTIIEREQKNQEHYYRKHRLPLLGDYLREEIKQKIRIVVKNKSFCALVPFWAVWPFETMVIPLKSRQSLLDFTQDELIDLAAILKRLTGLYDRLFNTSFPYSMGIHQAPTDGKKHPQWQLHFHFYPPLLRSATVKKHFVGYEMLAESQRDLTPEAAAKRLRKI